jgi:hypothetical protein
VNGILNNNNGGLNKEIGGLNRNNGGLNKEIGGLNRNNGGLNEEIGGLNRNNGGLNVKNESLNAKELNNGLKYLLTAIKENPGIQLNDLVEKFHLSIDTLDKQSRKLLALNLIERRGSKKTGGYWVVDSKEKSDEE